MNKNIKIGNREVGEGKPAFVIAEIACNHNGNVEIAKKMIDAAKDAGCDAAKFQSWLPGSLYNKKSDVYKILEEIGLSREDHQELVDYCESKGIIFMSSAFSEKDIDFLEGFDVPVHKIASMELTNYPLLRTFAKTGKPLILSTGCGNLEEVGEAVKTIKEAGGNDLILLHCIAAYPAKIEEMNLKYMNKLAQEFDVLVGLSDHSQEVIVPQAAVARGATVIERHMTLDKNMEGYDHKFCTEPSEFKEFITGIRLIEKALGTGERNLVGEEANSIKSMRRSILAGRDIQAGEIITEEMLSFKRPGEGLPIKEKPQLLGKKATREIKEGEYVKFEDVE